MSWTHRLLSPSRADNYLQYLKGVVHNFPDAPEYTEEMFIDKILGRDLGNIIKMQAGTATHSVFEKRVSANGHTFVEGDSFRHNKWLINFEHTFEIDYPPVREFWVRGSIGEFPIGGKVDAGSGTCAHDLKTTGNINIETYMESCQWKMYCLVGGFDKFVYDILKVDVNEEEFIVTIKDYQRLELHPYPTMRDEITEILDEYNSLLLALHPKILARIDELEAQGIKIDRSKFI